LNHEKDTGVDLFVQEITISKGFAADRGPLEFDSRVLGDLVLFLIV